MGKRPGSSGFNGTRKKGGRGHGPGGKMMPGEKAKDFKGTMKKLMRYLAPHKCALIAVFIFAIASTVFNIISPTILGNATDKVVEGLMSGTGIDFTGLFHILMVLLGMYGLCLLFGALQGWIMADVSQTVIYELRDAMSKKLDRLPLKYFDRQTHGEIQSRMVNDIETVNQTLSLSLTQMITSFTTIIGILIMMLRISVIMTVTALVVLPLSMIVIKLVVSRSQGHFKNQQKYLGYVNGHVEEMYTGHDIVKAFNREKESREVFDAYNDKLCESGWKSQFLSGIMMPVTMLIGNLAYVAVCLLGGYLAINGKVSIGDIQAFIQYVRSFNQPISQVANVANQLQSTAAASERVFEFLEEPEEEAAPENPVVLKNPEGAVEFEHVHFGYNPEHTIIHDFSVKVEPGQKIAIVGPTGAGKTTMVKLLMRFYDVSGGSIKVDGHDIREFDRGELRRMFGMVLQDTWLFKGSIEDNIRYGKLDATHEDVVKAADAAYAHRFIQTLPGGYGMELNEEASNVSQGQKQLLTIARAILADPKILILDEATSSVDTRTEVRIQKAMDNLMKGRTSFIIAHRLSTIRDADLILVMKEGDIVEMGRHEELLAKNGFYADLYNSQFEQTA